MPDEREHVAEDRHDAAREELVEHVHVARHARHQPPDGVPVVEADVDPLQVPVDLHPQVVHDALADELHRVGLRVLEREGSDENAEEDERDPVEAREVALRDVLVYRELRQVRLAELEERVGDDRGERPDGLPCVGPQVSHQAPHQPRVVGLAEYFFLVK